MGLGSVCWGLCPKAHRGDLLNQMLCFGATVLQTEGRLTDISGYEFNTVNLWLLGRRLSVCVCFGFKLRLLCQAWDINKLISFGAPFPKDAKRTISFQEICFTCIFQPVWSAALSLGPRLVAPSWPANTSCSVKGQRSASLPLLREWNINPCTSLSSQVSSHVILANHKPPAAFGLPQTPLLLSEGFEQL